MKKKAEKPVHRCVVFTQKYTPTWFVRTNGHKNKKKKNHETTKNAATTLARTKKKSFCEHKKRKPKESRS